MATRLCLGFCLIIALAKIECNVVSRLRRIEERLDGLQDRFDRESRYRREDLGNLLEKIGSNSARLNYSAIDVQCREPTETSDMSADWRKDLLQLTMAFKDEKLLNSKLRDRFPNVVDRMQTAEESMDRVEQIFQGVNDDIRDVATVMRMVLKEMDINQKKLDNIAHEINTTQMILDNNVNEININQKKLDSNANEINTNQKKLDSNANEINTNQKKLDTMVHEMAELKNELVEIKEAIISKTGGSISNNVRPKSCVELYERGIHLSGQYDVYPEGWPIPIRVFCDQDTDGGGWTVFQRRQDGSENFYREWLDYKNGFGDLDGEFWLGNEYLSILTSNSSRQLRIDIENFDGEKRYAKYDMFQIRPEDEKYMLKVDGYSGNAGNSMTSHNGYMFTTKDRDNDVHDENCAVRRTGAWWYSACYNANLNGQYVGRKDDWKGIVWYDWDGKNSLKFTEMKFK